MPLRALLNELHNWQWLGVLIARVVVGMLFFLSGRGKLFVPKRRQEMVTTLEQAHVPLAAANALFVSVVECLFGFLLLLGALTPLACLMLSGIMLVALATIKIPQIAASGPLDWLAEFFYLPEVLYLLILFWIFLSGPGWLSIDNLLF